MSSPKTTVLVLVSFAMVPISVIGVASATQEGDSKDEFSIPPEVRALLVQRLEILEEIELGLRALRKAGRTTSAEVLAATRNRLAGELEVAESREARLEILRKQVEVAREAERILGRLVDQEWADRHEVLRARLDRLAAAIDLALEMRKAGRREF